MSEKIEKITKWAITSFASRSPLTCQYDPESSFIVDLGSVVKTDRKSPQKELLRSF